MKPTAPISMAALLAWSLFAALGTSTAQAAATAWSGDARAEIRLITGSDTIGGAGIEAGLEFRYAPGWHGYWRTPGDAGIAPVLDWSGSHNAKTFTVAWPAPKRLVVAGLQNSVYAGDFVLPVKIAPEDARAPVRVGLALDYAACSTICVPVHADLALNLPAGPGRASAEAPLIAAALAKVPGSPASAGIHVLRSSLEPNGTTAKLVVEIESRARPFENPDLFVEGAGDGLPPAPSVEIAEGGHRATLTTALPSGEKPDAPLTLTVVDGGRSAEIALPAAMAQGASSQGAGRLIVILASALFGGLILNLMPCVLPILSIKFFSLTRHAGGERRMVRLGFVATALGIVISFLALATALIAIKASGAAIGWGIQFQQPWFLTGMAAVTVLFAASVFEWLPIRLPRSILRLSEAHSRIALVEACLAGVFSTLLATPCSAPFVGTAVGFALAQGPKEILAVFSCLGLGMAAPFLGAALVPGVVGFLPRPGPWMVRFRQALGILLLGTAVWLLVVLDSVAGLAAATLVAGVLAALLAFRFWLTFHPSAEGRPWSGMVTAAFAVLAVAAAFLPTGGGAASGRAGDGWQAFDPVVLDRALADGRTVFVDVTASWCLTCKVNELAALGTAPVRARLARPDVIRMRADWSRPDPIVADFLHRFARFGIPLDVVYGPNSPEGEPLPELLTAGTVLDAIERAAPRIGAADQPS